LEPGKGNPGSILARINVARVRWVGAVIPLAGFPWWPSSPLPRASFSCRRLALRGGRCQHHYCFLRCNHCSHTDPVAAGLKGLEIIKFEFFERFGKVITGVTIGFMGAMVAAGVI